MNGGSPDISLSFGRLAINCSPCTPPVFYTENSYWSLSTQLNVPWLSNRTDANWTMRTLGCLASYMIKAFSSHPSTLRISTSSNNGCSLRSVTELFGCDTKRRRLPAVKKHWNKFEKHVTSTRYNVCGERFSDTLVQWMSSTASGRFKKFPAIGHQALSSFWDY